MAECFKCNNDMRDSYGCDSDRHIEIRHSDGSIERFEPIPFGEESWRSSFPTLADCHDCGASPGEYHHPGCDSEACPNCSGQYFVCNCNSAEKDEIWSGVEA